MLAVEAAAALVVAVLVEVLLVEVALLREGVVSMDLDSLVVLEVVLRLVGPVRVALQVVLQVVLWVVPIQVVIHHRNRQDRWDHQKEVDDGCLYCRLILLLSLGILVGHQSILAHLLS